ncbi:MAG TPA: hypothetical protein VFW19_10765 [Allosphingosinicella sp.]|nr:hypothetical protein [Allosphingosinicella sp.]
MLRPLDRPAPADASEAAARDLLLGHKRELEAAIAANVAHRGDHVSSLILARLTARMRKFLAAVNRDLSRPVIEGPYGTAGFWGENGKAPEIGALIRESRRQREPFVEPVAEGFVVGEAA